MEFTTIKISNWGEHPWGEITFKPDCTEIKELGGGKIINQTTTYCPDDTSKEENLIFPTSFVNFFKILSSSSFGHQFWFNNVDGSTFMRYIYQNLVVPFTKLEDTNQQLREELARKDAEIVELKQQTRNDQTKEVIMRQIIETLRINFAMEIEKKDKDYKQQLQEKDERLEKDADLLKTREKQLELNNCRMVNLNQRIVNLTKQTEERENLCHRIMYEKDEDFEDLKNEVHEYYEETKRQNEAIEDLKITNQEIGRLNYLLILGTSEKKINDFSPEF